jgi:hypothetical protein
MTGSGTGVRPEYSECLQSRSQQNGGMVEVVDTQGLWLWYIQTNKLTPLNANSVCVYTYIYLSSRDSPIVTTLEKMITQFQHSYD